MSEPQFEVLVGADPVTGQLPAPTEARMDTVVAEHIDNPDSDTRASLNATYAAQGFWAESLTRSMGRLAPPCDTPTILWVSDRTTAMSSPVEYRPAACGTGSQKTGWNGKTTPTETRFAFHPGSFFTFNGASSDLALYGEAKPGAGAEASWPIIFDFNTSSGVDVIELAMFGSSNGGFRLEVNGQPALSNTFLEGPNGLTASKKATLTFPRPGARRIRIYLQPGAGLHSIRVPTGQSITKPTDTERVGVFIGDSYTNGAGTVNDIPAAGAGVFDTYALPALKALGCNRFALAGIGGSGFVGGGPTQYITRVSTVLGFTPHVMIVSGSVNDGPDGTGVQAAVEAFLAATTAVPERFVIGTLKSSYEANHDAVQAGAATGGVPFVAMRSFIEGTGKVTAPNGSGNSDVYLMADGAHPTYAAHRAIEHRVIQEIARLRA